MSQYRNTKPARELAAGDLVFVHACDLISGVIMEIVTVDSDPPAPSIASVASARAFLVNIDADAEVELVGTVRETEVTDG
ncbi:MAG: hypothetical protein AAGI08_00080 [Bacteroidota bacterium]